MASDSNNEEREALLKMFKGLQVADVVDAMDAVGLKDIGLMSREIRPLWRDTKNFGHMISGTALTVRFVPTDKPVPPMSPENYDEFIDYWYAKVAPGGSWIRHYEKEKVSPTTFIDQIQPGDVIVIDGGEIDDAGGIGSFGSLRWTIAGAQGIVTNGACRDTDELIKQKIPVYSRYIGRTSRPGRIELESTNKPINCGGAVVRPGDIIVADGDGVVVVPPARAEEVAKQAHRLNQEDIENLRELYKVAGLPLDHTVTQSEKEN